MHWLLKCKESCDEWMVWITSSELTVNFMLLIIVQVLTAAPPTSRGQDTGHGRQRPWVQRGLLLGPSVSSRHQIKTENLELYIRCEPSVSMSRSHEGQWTHQREKAGLWYGGDVSVQRQNEDLALSLRLRHKNLKLSLMSNLELKHLDVTSLSSTEEQEEETSERRTSQRDNSGGFFL